MENRQDAGDPWLEERFGRVVAAGSLPRRNAFWYIGSLAAALALLITFYVVLNQSMARAHQHWAQAAPGKASDRSDACVPGRSRDGCGVESFRLQGGGSAGLVVTGR